MKKDSFLIFVYCTITCFVVLLNIEVTRKIRKCSRSEKDFLNEVFAYDQYDEEIRRKDAFLVGGIKPNQTAFLLIGIPTVYREHNHKVAFYLSDTINSIINPLSLQEKNSILILIVLADAQAWKREIMFKRTMENFEEEIQQGLINIISILKRYYKPLANLKPTLNDTRERMRWRSKQVLDYAFMFKYAHNLCKYYLQVEDDVLAKKHYFYSILQHIAIHNKPFRENMKFWNEEPLSSPWSVLEFYKMGFIGRLIPSFYLPILSSGVTLYYNQMPVDWSYPHFARSMGSEKPRVMEFLFTHIGKQSSSLGT